LLFSCHRHHDLIVSRKMICLFQIILVVLRRPSFYLIRQCANSPTPVPLMNIVLPT
jgi:hypothetical protein